ncbi:MAG: HAD-IA family hydrolase, partial [Oscillospiraceae bacterium]
GFSIFTDEETKALIRRLGKTRGVLILTDSDAAGFKIRHHIEMIARGCPVKNAYIPALPGKEPRKSHPSKEGTLGVEGLPVQALRAALLRAGVATQKPRAPQDPITYTDLYEWGISGGKGSAVRRRALLQALGLPPRLSKRALIGVLSSLYSKEELTRHIRALPAEAPAVPQRPVLFWDFHGTLTLPDVVWFDAAMEAAAQQVPQKPLARKTLERYFSATCLPWFTVPSRDTRHLAAPGAWWAHCEAHFVPMFQRCGFTLAEAQRIAPAVREKVLQPQRYHLYEDAVPTLQALAARGYQSFILSNNFPELAAIVKALGLAPYFQDVLVSGRIGYDKPHPGIFAAARQAAAPCQNLWLIGDNPVDDIEGANAAGFVSVTVHGPPVPAATHSVQHLAQLLPLLP